MTPLTPWGHNTGVSPGVWLWVAGVRARPSGIPPRLLHHSVPGLLHHSVPGLNHSVPGLYLSVPGLLHLSVPGLLHSVPGLLHSVPGLLHLSVPGLQAAVLRREARFETMSTTRVSERRRLHVTSVLYAYGTYKKSSQKKLNFS